MVPYPAGGSADTLSRVLADGLTAHLGKPVVVENKSGAGGHIGAESVVNAPADGYTLMLATIAHNGAYEIYSNLRYDPAKDIKPVVLVAESPNVLMVPATSSFKSVQDVLTAAKAEPGKLNYGSAGIGSATHMAAELFTYMAKVDIMNIPFRGGAPALAALLGGQVDMTFETGVTARQAIATGKVRALAVTSRDRSEAFPDLPTIAESGVPGYHMAPWYTISVASGVPQPIVETLNKALNEVIAGKAFIERMDSLGVVPLGGTVQQAVERNQQEQKQWSAVIKAANIKVN